MEKQNNFTFCDINKNTRVNSKTLENVCKICQIHQCKTKNSYCNLCLKRKKTITIKYQYMLQNI